MSYEEQMRFVANYLKIGGFKLMDTLYESNAQKMTQGTADYKDLWSPTMAMLCTLNTSGKLGKAGLGSQPVVERVYGMNYMIDEYIDPTVRSSFIRAAEYRGTFIRPKYGVLLTNVSA